MLRALSHFKNKIRVSFPPERKNLPMLKLYYLKVNLVGIKVKKTAFNEVKNTAVTTNNTISGITLRPCERKRHTFEPVTSTERLECALWVIPWKNSSPGENEACSRHEPHIYSDTQLRDKPLEVTSWSLWASFNESVTVNMDEMVTLYFRVHFPHTEF